MVTNQSLPPQEALKRLHVMVNYVLIETGRLVSDPARQTPHAITLTNAKLKSIFPQALNRFHEALDELGEELGQARTVLQRELAINLAERARREQAKTVKQQQQQKQSHPIQQSESEAGTAVPQSLGRARKPSVDITNTVKKDEEPDVTMADADTKPDNQGHNADISHATGTHEKPSLDTSAVTLKKNNSPSQSTAAEKLKSAKEDGLDSDPLTNLPKEHDQLDRELFDKTPTTAGIKDIDFDNLFDDSEDNGVEKSNNDSAKSNKTNNNTNPVSEPTQTANPSSANSNPSPSKLGATTTTSTTIPASASIASNPITTTSTTTEATASSFLPGLESYANSISLPDGASADVPLDLDFFNPPPSGDDLNNSNNSSTDNSKKNPTSLDSLPQHPFGTTNLNSNNTNNNNENGTADGSMNRETLNQASLDDLFSFSGADNGNVNVNNNTNNSFDIDDLGDLGDILGDGGMNVDIDIDMGGVNGNGNENGNGNGSGNGNGNGNGDLMTTTDFDDMFGALTGP